MFLLGSFLADQTQSVIVRLVQIFLFRGSVQNVYNQLQGSRSGGYMHQVSIRFRIVY